MKGKASFNWFHNMSERKIMTHYEEGRLQTQSFSKNIVFFAVVLTSVVYIGWRGIFTIPFEYGIISAFWGIFLFLSELAGMYETIQQFYGMRNCIVPKKPSLPDDFVYPDVDVFIATYNEEEDLLYKTIIGCKGMHYPDKNKVHIYLCDDGNRPAIAAFAKKMEIGYLTREEHVDAKAGNLNNALSFTNSPYIATFDADMIPLHSFLMETIPYFFLPEYEETEEGNWHKRNEVLEDLKIGFIQAPQSFYNPDLFQYYLYAEHKVPNEQDFFYRDIQLSRNKSRSAIYGGSNTVLARSALEAVGGFYTGVITEDFATGIAIQNKGYTCYAIEDILAIGLSPTDLKSLIKQRERWARGCIQTLRKVNFFFMKKLTAGQKTSYFSSLLYWYTPFRRFMYIASPILFVLFDIVIVKATFWQIIVFWGPYYLAYKVALRYLSGNIRNNRWSNVYDTIMFPSLLFPVLLETFGISKKKFSITTKKKVDDSFAYQCKHALPHLVFCILSIISIAIAFSSLLREDALFYLIIIFWLIVNLYSLMMSFLFMMGRKSYRKSERFNAQLASKIIFDNKQFVGKTSDISEGGFSIVLEAPQFIPYDKPCTVEIWDDANHAQIKGVLVQCSKVENKWKYGFSVCELEEEQLANYTHLIYDRLPSLPQYIDKSSSSFEDLSKNLLFRLAKKPFVKNDKVPHIPFRKKFTLQNGGQVEVVEYSFETCKIKMKPTQFKEELIIEDYLNNQIKLRFMQKDQVDNTYVFSVINKQELINNTYFNLSLFHYQKEFEKELSKKQSHYKQERKAFAKQDELDERTLYRKDLS